MKPWLVVAVVLVTVGCNDAGSSSSTTTTTTTSTSPPPSQPAATSAQTGTTTGTTGAGTATPAQTATKPTSSVGYNANRIFQLADLKKVDLHANGHTIHCWIMDIEPKRQEGMMFLTDKDVKDDQGMIFVFSSPESNDKDHGFWMHNCPLGLDICYITPSKTVANVADGKPYNETSVLADAPYQYVLEMKANCAKKIGIGKGTKIEIPDSVKSAD